MSWMNVARAAKILALLAFLLPWLVVSCQGQELVAASGFDLATGNLDGPNGQLPTDNEGPEWWALAALIIAVAGLAATFLLRPVRQAAGAIALAALAALVLCGAGMAITVQALERKMSESPQGADATSVQMQAAVAQAVQIETRFGYWLTLAAFGAAAGAGAMAFLGKPFPAVTRRPIDPAI